ncbi:MAG: glutamine--tRNA ligase/YqeY domain fusion protein [Deltaproteobacteria bacterium]|nr:glutamine--tRNA ligase/YqeY domain fusion protein [Deltaproteobacteria bacterium]
MSTNHFIAERVQQDNESQKYGGRVVTRFPPEPNGYLHMGHAKSICLNFGLARDFHGACHLRMDDTNPTTEDPEYVEAIKRDVRWLGFDWADKMFYASDYYQRLFDIALQFIDAGKAYVDDLTEEQISAHRGSVSEAGKPSPFRSRTPAENRALFLEMQSGKLAPGSKVLRAKGDLASPNFKMRDPLMYRIKNDHHYRTGTKWHVYPFYDFAHCFSDAFEGITHSICTLEFENNRELYDWYLRQVPFAGAPKAMPEQIEFARLNVDYTVLSKRKLLELVKDKHVDGWDDPRMPTIAGLRRRGYTADAIRKFCDMIGIAKANSLVDIGKLEFAVREDLEARSQRLLCVVRPLKVVIENWPAGKTEEVDAGGRKLPMSGTLYIERDDFDENPPKDFHRLKPGGEVRLRFAYVIKCERVVKDASGNVSELRCSYNPDPAHKAKGIVHWVSAEHCKDVEVRLYDRLFKDPNPDGGEAHFLTHLNPKSLEIVKAKIEPHGLSAEPSTHWQFERVGYFFADPVLSKPNAPVFNRSVGLKDSWAAKKEEPKRVEVQKTHAKVDKEFAPAPTPALAAKRDAYQKTHGFSLEEAVILTQDETLNAFYESAATKHAPAVGRWIVNELLRALKDRSVTELPFKAPDLTALIDLIETNAISRRAGKDVFEVMLKDGGVPSTIVDKLGLRQVSDSGAIEKIVRDVIAANAAQWAKLKGGETKLLGFFVGQVMKASKGQANPQLAQSLLEKSLK